VTDWQANKVIPFASLVNQVLGIILGGSDTTRAAFAMLVALLAQDPGQWQAVREDQTLNQQAIEAELAEGKKGKLGQKEILRT